MSSKFTALLFFILISIPTSAQFTIPGVPQIPEATVKDSVFVRQVGELRSEYFDRARWLAEKRAIRKERNTLEFTSVLQLSQTQFDNWAAGGDNTFSGRAATFFTYKYHRNKFTFESLFEARYGLNYIEKKRFKNEDEFKIALLSSWQLAGNWSYAASTNFRSQFSTSYKSRDDDTRVSTFMSPGFLELAVGFKYEKNPLTLVLSPVGGNAVFVMDKELSAQGINGVPAGKHQEWAVGPSVQASIDYAFLKEIFRIRSYLYAFVNWNMTKRPLMRWENTLDINATKFVTTSFFTFIYYDRESNARRPNKLQVKYALAVGLSYTFKNK